MVLPAIVKSLYRPTVLSATRTVQVCEDVIRGVNVPSPKSGRSDSDLGSTIYQLCGSGSVNLSERPAR